MKVYLATLLGGYDNDGDRIFCSRSLRRVCTWLTLHSSPGDRVMIEKIPGRKFSESFVVFWGKGENLDRWCTRYFSNKSEE